MMAGLPAWAPAWADDKNAYNAQEMTAFAVHNLQGTVPDFLMLARSIDLFEHVPEEERDYYLSYQAARLESGFRNYRRDHDPIRVQVPGRVILPSEAEQDSLNEHDLDYPVRIVINDFEHGFFPYDIGGILIAVIPEDIEKIEKLRMDRATYSRLLSRAGSGRVARGSDWHVTVELSLIPLQLNTERPLVVHDTSFYALFGKIAEIELRRQKDNRPLWHAYQADWYVSPEQHELMNLKRR